MRVLITGSAGHVGKALVDAYRKQGDEVVGVDLSDADVTCDLDIPFPDYVPIARWWTDKYDIVICNAKLRTWEWHHRLAHRATRAIVNVASIYGVLGNDPSLYEGTEIEPTPAHYAASKGALIALTRWQATNLAPVRSNCVCPGGIFRQHSDAFRKRYESKVPLGRMACEQDVVDAVMFLASERAAYITGQVLMVDGGLGIRA